MSDRELRAVPVGGNQYMLDARRVSDLRDVVTIDGTPRGRSGNIAGYRKLRTRNGSEQCGVVR